MRLFRTMISGVIIFTVLSNKTDANTDGLDPAEVDKDVENGDVDIETSEMPTSQTEMEMQTPQGYTTVRFEDMLIEVINPSTLYVDWCPVINCDMLHGYKIRYSIKDNSSYNEVFVTPGISNYTISGLKPATEYVICVNAIDAKENVIKQCGLATQKTDEFEGTFSRSSPYIAVVAAAILLTTAIVVPLTILITAYERRNHFGTPNVTVIAGIMLLLVAVVVPVTFLFLRKCGPCSGTPDNQITIIKQDNDENSVTRKYTTINEEYTENNIETNITETRRRMS